jgi:transcriptional regulator with XRE-family HTH domain
MTVFTDWLDEQLKLNDLNDHQLALRAGLSHSVISKARAGASPKWEACLALASALQVPPELVFYKAGLLPGDGVECTEMKELRMLLQRLPEDDRQELVQIARLKVKRQAERKGPPVK